ncbi:hypothetical protein [Actinacidiphila epipremni]|uniref:Uncharacterized protein n=1 Tax=Actinacidiphila epipremni TaxID=2053013 RepID=A0ABX0ZLA3_9ACTN|nr:hypothetical protein [Actinacidiphila epipremni]NJP43287.1 hypothetical protein [Actinacidiphila epipremni]
MTNPQSPETALAVLAAARAFGPDVRKVVRRVLAAGVRLGATELSRSGRGHREGGR